MVPVTTNQMSLKHGQNPWNFHRFSPNMTKPWPTVMVAPRHGLGEVTRLDQEVKWPAFPWFYLIYNGLEQPLFYAVNGFH